ncbi:protein kinase domain-containing protein [Propioniciclava sinopodophylli]|uniref:protein kinase domain-containing protein n=1 Tax=Propioniciclava sinopodophylli TaxID=1837344 RepID=UPI0013F17C6F|nr:SIR2 family protein [Propioniciclava sinopodophylli]
MFSRLLAASDTAQPPEAYQLLWRLPIRGILSLNLDSFVKRSHSLVHPGDELKSFLGRDAARLSRFVHSPHHFLYQLHGTNDDYSSWVFTKTDLDSLYEISGYAEFLELVFNTCTVLYLGISAHDLAIGSPLLRLRDRGNDGPTHYWVTDRDDADSRKWAASCGVRLVNYPSGRHSYVLELLDRLGAAVAPEIEAEPVLIASPNPPTELPQIGTLLSLPLDELRLILNAHACHLLAQEGGIELFEEFLDEYEEAIDRAWFMPRKVEGTTLFGYTLQDSNLAGAFGRVFPAIGPDGNLCALKLLRREIRTNLPLLRSYRRGVRAMQVLAERGVRGMVAYQQASEIPAFVTMEWIDGPNLAVAKSARLLQDWDGILWITVELCSIIRRAHALPERVLHRDLRPANVMLRNGWSSRADWELLVLDFDLSTYKGAEEKSVLAERSVLGYLAPEQVDPRSRFSSRSSLVDSFGIGMTLYFLCGGEEPKANFEQSAQFERSVRSATRSVDEPFWRSVPRRIERLILSATREQQSQRPDVSQLLHEVQRLKSCIDDPDGVMEADLLCEELCARSEVLHDKYEWQEELDCATRETAQGMSIKLSGPLEGDDLNLAISWTARGTEVYGALRSIPDRVDRAASILRKAGWQASAAGRPQGTLRLEAHIAIDSVAAKLDDLGKSLDQAVSVMTLH